MIIVCRPQESSDPEDVGLPCFRRRGGIAKRCKSCTSGTCSFMDLAKPEGALPSSTIEALGQLTALRDLEADEGKKSILDKVMALLRRK
jgi:hypothetical protein